MDTNSENEGSIKHITPNKPFNRLPGILFITMPKSGSIFISRWLAKSLNLKEMKVAVCLFPADLIIREKLDELAQGNAIAQQHVPAYDINLRFIAARMNKVIVHVRDPRQATLSWVHHLDNFYQHREIEPACQFGLDAVTPQLPTDYFERSLSEKIDYQIENHLRQLVKWTEEWAEAEKNPYGLDVMFTTFESFVKNPPATLRGILEYYHIPEIRFDWSREPEKKPQNHYRKGLVDEWEEIFTIEQKENATNLIPPDLFEKFKW